jgi:hypothetical protein
VCVLTVASAVKVIPWSDALNVCMYVCMYVCMCICVCMHLLMRKYVSVQAYTHARSTYRRATRRDTKHLFSIIGVFHGCGRFARRRWNQVHHQHRMRMSQTNLEGNYCWDTLLYSSSSSYVHIDSLKCAAGRPGNMQAPPRITLKHKSHVLDGQNYDIKTTYSRPQKCLRF